jgi:hypothetical protein
MMVRMRERMAPDEPAAIMPIWRETTRKLALLLVPLLCVLGIAAHDLITVLFTDVYGASVPVFRIWLLVLLLAAVPAHGPLRVLDDRACWRCRRSPAPARGRLHDSVPRGRRAPGRGARGTGCNAVR